MCGAFSFLPSARFGRYDHGMSTSVTASPQVSTRQPRWFLRRRFVLIMSCFVIPFALAALLNSYGPLTQESALRMAFTSVAGQTIAIGGALAALVITVVSPRTRNIPGIVFFALLAVVVTANAVMAMGATGQLLLDRLDQLAEIAALN